MQNKIIYSFLVILSVLIGLIYFSIPKVAYINIDEIYSDFKMKKELETKLLSTQKARERVLDSLQQDITRRATEIQILKKPDEAKYKEFNAKREELNRLEERMEADTRAQMGEYKAQIGKQLNQYIKDFGNKNGYDFILGKDESFNVPFAKENRNITADVKKYVNEVYGGGK